MKRRKMVALSIISCFVLSGCGQIDTITQDNISETTQMQEGNAENEAAKNETVATEQADEQKQHVTVTYQTEGNRITAEDGREIYIYECSYPVVTIVGNEQAAQEIAKDQEKRKNEFMKSARESENSAKEVYEHITEEEQKENFQNHEDYVSYNVERNDSSVISFQECISTYSGGAHGDSYITGVNYDCNTGKLLTLDDIFEDKAAAVENMKSYILKQCESPYYQERLYDNYQNDIDSILTEEFWYLGKDGIHVISNEYMLGPYAAGNFEFIVPYTELEGLKEAYKQEGAYIYPVLKGSSIETDLDSDGIPENICFNLEQTSSWATDENGEESEVYDTPKCTLIINGQDITEQFMELTQYYPDLGCEYYYVVDLDRNDAYKELAICDYGCDAYNTTYFLRYMNGKLSYVGSLQEVIDSETCNLWGDGTLQAKVHSELLETFTLEYNYILENETLKVQEQEWYPIDTDNYPEEYKTHAILKEVTVYTEKNTESEKRVLSPNDGNVTFPATDNKEWIQVKSEDGTIYYMHMKGFSEIDSAGNIEEATDVYENLLLAG